jgi:S-methylmethionine-dependent homocysteine/selenocysteine methylase
MNHGELILLDGGMGRELQRRRLLEVKTIWAGFALINHPEAVRDIHVEFIEAGADVITTSNYCVVPTMLQREALAERFEELTLLAGNLANQARDLSGRDEIKIAGSLPPLDESYRPDKVAPLNELVPIYRTLARTLAPHVDLFICETMSTAEEARAAAIAAGDLGKPVWVSWSLQDTPTGKLRSGESIHEALTALSKIPVDAYLFNCCSMESITHALPTLRTATDKKIGGYANVFAGLSEKYEMGTVGETPLRDDVPPDRYLAEISKWREQGADIIGGCCGVGPDYIRRLHQARTTDGL